MNQFKKTISFVSLLGAQTLVFADLTVGLGVGVGQAPYKDYDNIVAPLPVIQYQKDRFYIDGLKAGIHLYNAKATKLNVHVGYLPLEFKGSDTDDRALKQLDKRKSTMTAGIGLSHRFNQQKTEVKVSLDADILDNSNTLIVQAELNHAFQASDKVMIVPAAGLVWVNEDHNNYYFGISKKESAKSGLKQYSADSSVHPYLGVGVHYSMTDNVSSFGGVRIDFLSKEVKDSPMVDRSVTGAVAVGVTYTFK